MIQRKRALLLAGMLLVAMNFRPAITSVPPVLESIRTDLHLSYTAVSLLTTIPTLLMGVFAFSAAPVSEWLGRGQAIFWSLVLVAIGTVFRVWSENVVILFGTTVVVGIGIAISQALLPSIVSEYFSNRAAIVTGLYTTALSIGAALASGGTAPLTDVFGSWPAALAFWAVLAVVAAIVWLPATQSESSPTAVDETTQGTIAWKHPSVWLVTFFFSGQTLMYYSELTWMAPVYVELGVGQERAGFILTVFMITQIAGSLGIPALADRWSDLRPWIALTVVMNAVGLAGILWLPFVSPIAWAALTGVGMGGMFALGLTLPVDVASNADSADRLSAVMIGIGYVAGAIGPFVIGAIRDSLGSYNPSLLALVVLSVLMLVVTGWFRPSRSV